MTFRVARATPTTLCGTVNAMVTVGDVQRAAFSDPVTGR
jgi:hypothetical protein